MADTAPRAAMAAELPVPLAMALVPAFPVAASGHLVLSSLSLVLEVFAAAACGVSVEPRGVVGVVGEASVHGEGVVVMAVLGGVVLQLLVSGCCGQDGVGGGGVRTVAKRKLNGFHVGILVTYYRSLQHSYPKHRKRICYHNYNRRAWFLFPCT